MGQSATPAMSCALALIKPTRRANSGSFRMTMKKPPTSGTRVNPSPVSKGILERRALNSSTQVACTTLFMLPFFPLVEK